MCACVCVEGGGVLLFLRFYMTKTQNIYDNQKKKKSESIVRPATVC